MKLAKSKILALGTAALYAFTAAPGYAEDPKGHDHADHKGHDHAEGKGHDHDHDHEGIVAGPNGGRLFTSVEPHAEFFVTKDRKVQISFFDEENKPVAAGGQSITIIAGDRSAPTRLAFEKSGNVLVSDNALPEGNDFPVVVQIKTSPDAKAVLERFNLNMNDCPTCDNKEYACTCKHGE